MAYRRRQGITRASTFKEEIHHPPDETRSSSSPTLAAQTIRASAAYRESSLSSAYGDSDHRLRSKPPFVPISNILKKPQPPQASFGPYEDKSMNNESYGFWGVLAMKAKAILEDENESQQFETPGRTTRPQMLDSSSGDQFHQPYKPTESFREMDNPRLRNGLEALTSSLNQIGDSFDKAFEEDRTIVENKTADIIQETCKLEIRRNGNNTEAENQSPDAQNSWQPLQPMQPLIQSNQETKLKASRDVAMATAAKAKLLLRELKTVKADLTFAKERCAQLEEENKNLRERRVKGNNPADDDLIRLQLETLLAEKARLAHENSVYACENRFLREIVEYHQLTMHDVVYLDEDGEEVTEVYPNSIPGVSVSPPLPQSLPSEIPSSVSLPVTEEFVEIAMGEDSERHSTSSS